jgi:hypothetical protein
VAEPARGRRDHPGELPGAYRTHHPSGAWRHAGRRDHRAGARDALRRAAPVQPPLPGRRAVDHRTGMPHECRVVRPRRPNGRPKADYAHDCDSAGFHDVSGARR